MKKLIIIGSSTGGPRVLFEIFTGLPALQVPIILVQHMPLPSNNRLARRIGQLCPMEVCIADQNTLIKPGTIFIAKSEEHLLLKNNQKCYLTDSEKINFVRPSIDVTMKSLVPEPGVLFTGIILTGMGSDGAAGIVHMKNLGAVTVAQEPATCMVKSMPESAISTGSVDLILSPQKIREFLISF